MTPTARSFLSSQELVHRYLNHSIFLVLKKLVCIFDPAKRIGMGNKRFRIDLALCNEAKRLLTVASIYTAGFKGKIISGWCSRCR